MIITRTPYRVSLVGGGAGDHPDWFRDHGGVLVGGAIDKFCHVTVRKLPPFHPFSNRIAYREVETTLDVNSIRHPAVRACLQLKNIEGVEVTHTGDLPGRSGTGSSSSFVVGLLNALSCLKGEYASPAKLARDAMHVEQDILGENVGCQDQTFAAFGGLNVLRFHRDGGIDVRPLALSPSHQQELENNLLLFFTRVERTSSDIAGSYENWDRHKEANFAIMRLAEEAIDCVRRKNWERLGWCVDQSWRAKCSLSPKVAYPGVNELYAACRLAGAFGGKLTGAGGGGSLLLVCPCEKRQRVVEAAVSRGCVPIPFAFCKNGSHVIFSDV